MRWTAASLFALELCPELRVLDKSITAVAGSDLIRIVERCAKLETLELRFVGQGFCADCSAGSSAVIAQNARALRALTRGNPAAGDAHATYLARACRPGRCQSHRSNERAVRSLRDGVVALGRGVPLPARQSLTRHWQALAASKCQQLVAELPKQLRSPLQFNCLLFAFFAQPRI